MPGLVSKLQIDEGCLFTPDPATLVYKPFYVFNPRT
jgi:hypothetical protein